MKHPRHTSQPNVSTVDIVESHISRDVVVSSNDRALLRDLVRFAIEEIGHTIEIARQRNHVPHGLKAYADDAARLLARLQ